MSDTRKNNVQLTRPKIQRTYVTARDPDTGETKHVTLYGATPSDVIEQLTQDVEPAESMAQPAA